MRTRCWLARLGAVIWPLIWAVAGGLCTFRQRQKAHLPGTLDSLTFAALGARRAILDADSVRIAQSAQLDAGH
jgi:hypothetical protein